MAARQRRARCTAGRGWGDGGEIEDGGGGGDDRRV